MRSRQTSSHDRVVEAFRNFVRTQPDFQVQPAQIDEELEFAKLRLTQEIVTAAFSNDAGARVLLDSDAQVLRALEALPDAKRLADSAQARSGEVSHKSTKIERTWSARSVRTKRTSRRTPRRRSTACTTYCSTSSKFWFIFRTFT
jgi:hypothetical protein